jgi:hypothetical protein
VFEPGPSKYSNDRAQERRPPVAIECATVCIVASQLDSVCAVNRDRYSGVLTRGNEPGLSSPPSDRERLAASPIVVADRRALNKIAEITSPLNEPAWHDYPVS